MKSSVSYLNITCAALLSLYSLNAQAANCPDSSSTIDSSVTNCTVVGSSSEIHLNFTSGFSDTTSVIQTGGNNGTQVGEQRKLAFIKAAEILADQIISSQTIEVDAQFKSLECDANSAILGAAGATTSITFEESDNLEGVPIDTFYPIALASHLYGSDLKIEFSPNIPSDIIAEFNSDLGQTNCLRDSDWYYGFDQAPNEETGFLPVLLHEMIHGLGFSSLVNPVTGAKPDGIDDIYSNFLFVPSRNDTWNNLSNFARVQSATSVDDLFWFGEQANSQAIGQLTNGFLDQDNSGSNVFNFGDLIQMYAPSSLESGSSISHFDITATPDELMEPNLTSDALDDIGLALCLLKDIGWGIKLNDDNFYLNVFCQSLSDGETYAAQSTETLTIDFASNSDTYTYDLSYEGEDATNLISEINNGVNITIPDNGEFAGEYTLTVSNGVDSDISITITRPLVLDWSASALLNDQEYTLSIIGGASGSVYNLATDPGNALIFTNQANTTVTNASASDDAENNNPAIVNVNSEDVVTLTDIDIQVSSQANTYASVENTVTVYPSIAHNITVIDSNGEPVSNVTVDISNHTLAELLDLKTDFVTDSAGQVIVNLPDTNHQTTLLLSKDGFNSLSRLISNSENVHEFTLVESTENTPSPEVETTNKNTTSRSASLFGSMSVWFLLSISGLMFLRQPKKFFR